MINVRAKKEYKDALAMLVAAARKMAMAEARLLKVKPEKRTNKQEQQTTIASQGVFDDR